MDRLDELEEKLVKLQEEFEAFKRQVENQLRSISDDLYEIDVKASRR